VIDAAVLEELLFNSSRNRREQNNGRSTSFKYSECMIMVTEDGWIAVYEEKQ